MYETILLAVLIVNRTIINSIVAPTLANELCFKVYNFVLVKAHWIQLELPSNEKVFFNRVCRTKPSQRILLNNN